MTPARREAVTRQFRRFEAGTGCGLEVLALRPAYGGRPAGSMAAVAEAIHDLIRSGGRDLTKRLHLNRGFPALEAASADRQGRADALRAEAEREFVASIDATRQPPDHLAAVIILAGRGRR